jgi:hypothetical protein
VRSPKRRSGGRGTKPIETSRCWLCPGHTFNAGKVCKACLDAGHDPIPDALRCVHKPKIFNDVTSERRAELGQWQPLVDAFTRSLARKERKDRKCVDVVAVGG